MTRNEALTAIVIAVLTASSSPWWWPRLAHTAEPSGSSTGIVVTPATIDPVPPPPPPPVPPPADCTGKYFIQLAAGPDREGLKAVVDKARAADAKFRTASLYAGPDDRYFVAMGCFTRFEADALRDDFAARGVMANEPLVTQGRSLQRRVY